MSTKTSGSFSKIVVSNTSAFDDALNSALTTLKADKSNKLFLLFTGEDVGSSGKSWCPDCNDAKPILNKVFAKVTEQEGGPNITLLEMPLVRAEYSGQQGHPYRVHNSVKLARIPTLMRWGRNGRKTGELVEDGCKNESDVLELVGEE